LGQWQGRQLKAVVAASTRLEERDDQVTGPTGPCAAGPGGQLGQDQELGLGCQKRIENGFGILTAKLNLNQDYCEFKSRDIFKVKLQF
jgi:hypothetical protein